jgi:hypothetical protein
MSDQPVTLDLPGRIVRDLRGDVRELRTRVGVLEIDVAGLKVAMAGFSERLSDLQKTVLAGVNEVGESNRRLERLLTDLTSRPASRFRSGFARASTLLAGGGCWVVVHPCCTARSVSRRRGSKRKSDTKLARG